MNILLYLSVPELINFPPYSNAMISIKVAKEAINYIEVLAHVKGHERVDNVFSCIGCSPELLAKKDFIFTNTWYEGYSETLNEALKYVDAILIVPNFGSASKIGPEDKILCAKNLVSVMTFSDLFESESDSLKIQIKKTVNGLACKQVRKIPTLYRGGRHK